MQFHLKKFSVKQECSAMKVGSDSILLGSWMRCVGGHMLDIGTGTGILALMAAQKNNDADIVAIDIDADSAAEASENFASSPWSDRISSKHISLADFTNSTYEKFDTIFSNPPYFEGDLKSPDERRAQARQAETLSHDHLIDSVVKLLEKGGFFSLVLPFSQSISFVLKAVGKGLFLTRESFVYTKKNSKATIVLLEFSNSFVPIVSERLDASPDSEELKRATSEFLI